MTVLSYKNLHTMSDDAIIQAIGEFVRHHRLEQNMTQAQLAEKAGINRTTLSDLELGRRCQLLTLIQVLRMLDQLQILEVFSVQQQVSPLLLAEMEMKKRKRASGSDDFTKTNYPNW
ncbi:MAG: helix-turn-helix domain-containing protein [Flavobacteriales bacterium]